MKAIISLFFVFTLIGCSMGRSYHDSDNMYHLGYSDTQVSERAYRVSYAGYGIPESECADYALLRASEITRKNGHRYFRLLDEKQSSHSETLAVPGSTHTTATVSKFGKSSMVNASSYSTGFMASVNYPVSTIMIEILKENDNAAGTLDAEIIWKSLGEKYSVSR